MRKCMLIVLWCFISFSGALAQKANYSNFTNKLTNPSLAVKSNLLYGATTTLNLGLEIQLSGQYTLDVSAGYNPWTFSENRKFKHILVQPEVRYWLYTPFNGHFLGVHAHYAHYNVGALKLSDFMKEHRFQGNLYGAGLSYGYQWYLGPRWNLEGTLGVGYAYLDYDRYDCRTCGRFIDSNSKHYIGVTKAGLSLIYLIK